MDRNTIVQFYWNGSNRLGITCSNKTSTIREVSTLWVYGTIPPFHRGIHFVSESLVYVATIKAQAMAKVQMLRYIQDELNYLSGSLQRIETYSYTGRLDCLLYTIKSFKILY